MLVSLCPFHAFALVGSVQNRYKSREPGLDSYAYGASSCWSESDFVDIFHEGNPRTQFSFFMTGYAEDVDWIRRGDKVHEEIYV